MQAASENLAFEQAAAIRDRLKALAHITVAPGHQRQLDRRCRRGRAGPGRRPGLRPGVLLSRRPQLRQSRLLSEPCPGRRPGRAARSVPRPVLRRADRAAAGAGEPHAGLAGPARRGAVAARAAQGRAVAAAARRAPPADRPGRDQRPPCARPPARREQLAGQAAAPPRRAPGPARAARADRDLRQQPHHGHRTRSAPSWSPAPRA